MFVPPNAPELLCWCAPALFAVPLILWVCAGVIRGFGSVIKRRCGFRPQIRTGCAGAVGVRFNAVLFLRQYGPTTGRFALNRPATHIRDHA